MRRKKKDDAIVPVAQTSALAFPTETIEALKDSLRASKSENTIRAYKSDWRNFMSWCESRNVQPLPAATETVAAYLAESAKRFKVNTVQRRISAIVWAHRAAGHELPTRAFVVKEVMKGVRRKGGGKVVQKAAADANIIKRLVATCDETLVKGLRDRAILLLGYAGAFRRATLTALNIEDLTFRTDRVDVRIRREKQDQTGKGRTIGVLRTKNTLCPVMAVQKWINALGQTKGPLFRGLTRHGAIRTTRLSAWRVAAIVKESCVYAGLDPTIFSGHSLRSGHVTEAARQGARLDEIMRVTGHHSVEMVMRYIREADSIRGTSAGKIGLENEEKTEQ